MMGSADKPFIVVREEALCLMREEEDRVVLMRSVEKATPALSVPSACVSVVDSVADALRVGGVVLGDGGLSCSGVGGVGLCASRACCCDAMVGPSAELVSEQAGLAVCDAMVGPSAEQVSEQARLAICDAMFGRSAELVSEQAGLAVCDAMVGPSAELVSEQAGLAVCDAMVGPSAELVSEQIGLAVCDAMVGPSAELDFTQAGLAGCGTVVDVCDVVVCGGETVIEGLCDGDRVAGDRVGCCVDTAAVIESLCDGDRVSGGGDNVGCCVDTAAVIEGLCDVDRVAGGGDTVVFGVSESVCGVRMSMIAGELDVCGVGIVMPDEAGEAGELSRVDVSVSGDDVVCGDDPLLVCVGDCLSVVGDAMCGTAVARGDRGDAELSVVLGPGMAPPGGVDGLVCVDGSLRPKPPPCYAMCLRYGLLLAAAC